MRFAITMLVALTAAAGAAWGAAAQSPARPTEPAAQSEAKGPAVSLQGRVGFSDRSGAVRPGRFAPVHVDLTTKGEPFSGEIVVRSISQEKQAFDPQLLFPCEVGLNSSKRFSDVFLVRGTDDSLVAELWVRGRKINESHMALTLSPPSRQTVLALAETEGGLDHLSFSNNPLPSRRRKIIYGKAAFLPTLWRGYDGIDAVVVDGGSLAEIAEDQIEALNGFVRSGGRLVVCTGSAWQKVESSFLGEMLPVSLEGTTTIPSPLPPRSGDAASTATAARLLVCRATLRGNGAPVEVFWQPQGVDFPLGARQSLGSGSVTFLACRLDDALVRGCKYLEGFSAMLLEERKTPVLDGLAQEMADRIDRDLKSKSLLPIPSADAVGTAFLGYLAVFLPALFLTARWWGGNRWAWMAMPLGFVGATVVVFAHGRTEAGRQRAFVQLNFVEASAAAPTGVGRSFASVYSTSADRFQVHSPDKGDLFLPLQTSVVKDFKTLPFLYSTRPAAVVRDLEVPARAARSFQLEFLSGALAVSHPKQMVFSRRAAQNPAVPFVWTVESERLTGDVANETGVALRQAALIARGRAKELGLLRPGQALSLDLDPRAEPPLSAWSARPKGTQASRDLSLGVGLAEAGREILGRKLAAESEAFLVGWSEVNPKSFAAVSRAGQPPIFTGNSSSATWFVTRYPIRVQGGAIHLESADFEVEGWTSGEFRFPWDRREQTLDALGSSLFEGDWLIRFRPRMGFLSAAGGTQWPIQTAWGSLGDNWEGQMDIYDFAQERWAPAPDRYNDRRILIPPLACVDRSTGELWVRLRGEPPVAGVRTAPTLERIRSRLYLSLNYELRP